jgi:glycosyltransferase involved in cell wall biosynthesis
MKPAVVVVQPGSHHLSRTAAACGASGILSAYVTGIAYQPDRFPYSALALLPRTFRSRLTRELARRACTGVDADRIRTRGTWEWLHLAADRLHGPRRLARWLMDRRNRSVSRLAGRIAARNDAVVWGAMDASREAFRTAKPRGATCILDAFVGHHAALNEVLEEECRRTPRLRSVTHDWIGAPRLRQLSEELALADQVVAGSPFAARTFSTHGVPAEKISVVRYGVDTELFAPPETGSKEQNTEGTFRMLFVGNISVRKGSHYLLEAMRFLVPQGVSLTMIGTMEDAYFARAYRDRFDWLPFIRHTELPSYFRGADAYVFPSLFEGSALSIYEALASGLPVVTTEESGSVVRDGTEGFLIPSRSADAIAEKILLLKRNAELRTQMSANARKRAEEFTWESYGTNVVDLIGRLG